MQLSEIPSYVNELHKHPEQVIEHLLPNAIREGVYIYADSITLNTHTLAFVDDHAEVSGNLHRLWMHVKGMNREQAKADIEHFLLNVDMPSHMERFSFSPEEMDDPNGLYGDWMEIFPDVRLYAGTTTLLAGYNGSGKSTLATQIAHIASGYDVKSFILSPEMPPAVTWRIMQRQATNISNPTHVEWERTRKHCLNNFIVSTTEDRITPRMAITQFDEAYQRGCRLIILDSLTCVRSGHELHEQADFSDLLRNWARNHPDAYLLVLAHMRKPAGYTGGQISRYDIRGAGEISDLAGHVWLLQRKNPFSQKEQAMYGDYDAKIIVDKNRANGKLACKALRFSNIQKLFHVTRQPPCYIDYLVAADNVTQLNRPPE